jgi:gamma-glutamylcyclotransferase (GGCT)/AIG2-like uncharacterized protein YtfP
MDPDHMARLCPGAEAIATARLHEYRVAFVHDEGVSEGGVATIVEDPLEDVWGVVWSVHVSHLPALDEWEAYPIGYDRRPFVVDATDPLQVFAYVANGAHPERPTEDYLSRVLAAAAHHGLPPEYIERLRRWARQSE